MFVVNTTAEDPVEIFWNLEYNDYELNPQEFVNRGDYTVLLQSCVKVGQESICVFSEPWTISVYDPCTETSLLASGWDKIISAPILGYNELNYGLQINIEGGQFGWPTIVDLAYSGSQLCGNIIYTIEPLSYIDDDENPLVVEEEGLIKLRPTENYLPGLYELIFTGTLEKYP